MKCYSVYDKKAMVYNHPYFLLSDAVAIRSFKMATANPESPMNAFPEDFILMSLGEFDNNTGKMELYEHPVEIFTGTAAFAAMKFLNQKEG